MILKTHFSKNFVFSKKNIDFREKKSKILDFRKFRFSKNVIFEKCDFSIFSFFLDSQLQLGISPWLLGASGWNLNSFLISDMFFGFWSFPVPIIQRCSPIFTASNSIPSGRTLRSRKSVFLLTNFGLGFLRVYLELGGEI